MGRLRTMVNFGIFGIYLTFTGFCAGSQIFVPGDPCNMGPGCDPTHTFLDCKVTTHSNSSLSFNCRCNEGSKFDPELGQQKCRLQKGQSCGQWGLLRGQDCESNAICKNLDSYHSVCVASDDIPSSPWLLPAVPLARCLFEDNGGGSLECESFRTFLICVGRQGQGSCVCDKDSIWDENLEKCVLKLDQPCFQHDDTHLPQQPCARGSECRLKWGDDNNNRFQQLTSMTCQCKPDTVADTHYFVKDRRCQSIFDAPCNTTNHGDCLATQFLQCGSDHLCGCGPDATFDPDSVTCLLNYGASCLISDTKINEQGEEVSVKRPKCGKGSECKGTLGVNRCYCKAGHVPFQGRCVATVGQSCDSHVDCDPESFLTCGGKKYGDHTCQCCDGSDSMVCGASGKCRCRWALDQFGDCKETGHKCEVPGVTPDDKDCGQYRVCQYDDRGELMAYNFSCPVTTVLCPDHDSRCNEDEFCRYVAAGYFRASYEVCDLRTVWCQKSASCQDPKQCPCEIKRKPVIVRHDPSYF